MNLSQASINGVPGKGIAITQENNGHKKVSGTFIASHPALCIELASASETMYTGILQDGGEARQLTFPILISRTQDNTITFVVSGNPYLHQS